MKPLTPLLAMAFVVAGHEARADALTDSVLRALRAEGYTEIEIERTWLGRTRIEAEGPRGSREIVFNPRTGEILRDLFERDDDYDMLDIDDDRDDDEEEHLRRQDRGRDRDD